MTVCVCIEELTVEMGSVCVNFLLNLKFCYGVIMVTREAFRSDWLRVKIKHGTEKQNPSRRHLLRDGCENIAPLLMLFGCYNVYM